MPPNLLSRLAVAAVNRLLRVGKVDLLPYLASGPSGSSRWHFKEWIDEGVKLNAILAACMTVITEGCASIGVRIAEPGSEAVSGAIIPLEELNPAQQAINTLLTRPNEMQTFDAYKRQWVYHMYLAGTAYTRGMNMKVEEFLGRPRVGTAGMLKLLRPDRTKPEHNDIRATKFEYTLENGSKITYKPEEILWTLFPHPADEFVPLSPLTAAGYAVDTSNMGQRWNYSLMKRDGKPSGVLRVKSSRPSFGKEERQAIRKEFEDETMGSDNAGRIAIINADNAELQMYGMTPKELDWERGDMRQLRKICAVLNVPSPLVGDTDASTYHNMEAADEKLYVNCILPLMKRFLYAHEYQLRKWYKDETLTLTLDISDIPALQTNSKELAEEIALEKYLTVNEAREKAGYEPLTSEIGELTFIEIERPQVLPAVDVPEPDMDIDAPDDIDAEEEQPTRSTRAEPTFPRSKYPTLELRAGLIKKREERRAVWGRKYQSLLLQYWRDQADRVVSEYRYQKRAIDLNSQRETEEYISVFEKFYKEMLTGMAVDGMEETLGASLAKAGLVLNQERPLFTEWLTEELTSRSELINKTTAAQIKEILDPTKGELDRDVAAEVRKVLTGDNVQARANAVVRTETGRADSEAIKEGYAQITEQTGKAIREEWISARDGNVRDDHVEMDGRLADESGVWSNPPYGFSTRGPLIDGPAEFVVNCRCTTAGIMEGEELI